MDTFTAYATCVMAFTAPTLAFISVNRTICVVRQMILSLLLGGLLGALLAWGLTAIQAPSLAVAAVAMAVFLACGERMFTELLPGLPARLGTVLGIFLAGVGLAWISPPILPFLLVLHMALSLRDLRRNWNRMPAHGQFPFEAFECGSGTRDFVPRPEPGLTFSQRRNVHVLFLETIHSRSAMRDLYDSDDFGLTDYLEKNGFTVHENAYSSQTYTSASLFSLLHMMHYYFVGASKLSMPQSFSILKNNGYEVAAFDASLYVFYDYIKYLDCMNFDIPGYVKFLYGNFLPFFMQSRLIRACVGGEDVYMTDRQFEKIFDDVRSYLLRNRERRKCVLVRFGAQHMGFNRTFDELKAQHAWWKGHYRDLYAKSVENIRTMTDFLLKEDPESVILLLGDHGTMSYRGCWGGSGDCNANIRACGVEPRLVARDFCDVLTACRCPSGPVLKEPVAPVNFFRDIFVALGCDPEALEPRCRPFTILLDEPYVVARDGVLLKDWERLSEGEIVDIMERHIRNAPDRAENHLAVAELHAQTGQHDLASRLIRHVWQRFPQSVAAGDARLRDLLRQGRAREARAVLEAMPPAPMTADRLWWLIWQHALEGDIAGARRMLSSPAALWRLRGTRRAVLNVHVDLLAGDEPSALRRIARLSPDGDMDANFLLSCAFAAMDGGDETAARRWIAALGDGGDDTVRRKIALASLHGNGFDWAAREADIREAMALPGLRPVILDIWLAGVLEQLGRHDDAAKVLLDAAQEQPIPGLLEQTGLFFLRRGFQGVPGETAVFLKRHAYAAMARDNALLATPHLFDADFYARRYGELLGDMPPLRHFLSSGLMLGLDPNPLFGAMWNMAWSPEDAAVGASPLPRFLKADIRAGWPASPTFWPAAWAARHPECLNEGIHPILHALRERAEKATASEGTPS